MACNGIGILNREITFHDVGQQTWSKPHPFTLDIFHFRLKETSEGKPKGRAQCGNQLCNMPLWRGM